MEVLDRALDAVGDHHHPRRAADLFLGDDLLVEVVDHDLGLGADRVVGALDERRSFFCAFSTSSPGRPSTRPSPAASSAAEMEADVARVTRSARFSVVLLNSGECIGIHRKQTATARSIR